MDAPLLNAHCRSRIEQCWQCDKVYSEYFWQHDKFEIVELLMFSQRHLVVNVCSTNDNLLVCESVEAKNSTYSGRISVELLKKVLLTS